MKTKTLPTILVFSLFFIQGLTPTFAETSKLNREQISSFEFQNNMRKLWEDHISWTRSYLVSASLDAEDQEAVLKRLLKNQVDIGNAFRPFYGDEAANKLTVLLTDHIEIAGALIANLIAVNTEEANAAMAQWKTNGDAIAKFLSEANPNYWPYEEMKAMMSEHLALTTVEVTAQIAMDWAASIAAYDKVHDAILKMADMLSKGIIKQFPDSFEEECYPEE